MASEAPMRPGTTLGGEFEITGPLARGGMGTVYTARRRSTGLPCALKVLHPELLDNARSRERFTREADLCARIESPHVVKILASGIEAPIDTPWIAMELVAGEDMEKVCRARGAFPLEEVRAVLAQLFDAIGAAHAVGVVHRDLKPQNVLLARDGDDPAQVRVKVLDFGISKASHEEGTETTAAVGSPLWMAPEQANTGRLSPATDVFALSLMAFRLFTGRMYWLAAATSRPAIREILVELLVKPLPTASARARELNLTATFPDGFDAWFDRAMQRDPARRFADARIAWAALAPVLTGEGYTAAPLPEAPPAPLPAPLPAAAVAATPPVAAPPVVAPLPLPLGPSAPKAPATSSTAFRVVAGLVVALLVAALVVVALRGQT